MRSVTLQAILNNVLRVQYACVFSGLLGRSTSEKKGGVAATLFSNCQFFRPKPGTASPALDYRF